MSGQSRNRDAYEARMEFNLERKAELLAASPFLRHKKRVARMLQAVSVAQSSLDSVTAAQLGPL